MPDDDQADATGGRMRQWLGQCFRLGTVQSGFLCTAGIIRLLLFLWAGVLLVQGMEWAANLLSVKWSVGPYLAYSQVIGTACGATNGILRALVYAAAGCCLPHGARLLAGLPVGAQSDEAGRDPEQTTIGAIRGEAGPSLWSGKA